MVASLPGVASLSKYTLAFRLTSELGLTAVRSRSRENNTQLFSNTLAPLRYALYGSNIKIKAQALYIIRNLLRYITNTKCCISSISQEIAYHPSENEYISLSGEYIIKSQEDTR